jgi:hypothetical protein
LPMIQRTPLLFQKWGLFELPHHATSRLPGMNEGYGCWNSTKSRLRDFDGIVLKLKKEVKQ